MSTTIDIKQDFSGLEYLVTFSSLTLPSFSIIFEERYIVHFPTFVEISIDGFRTAFLEEREKEMNFRLCLWKNWVRIRGSFMRKKYQENDVLVGPLPSSFPDKKLGFKNKGGLFALICREDTPKDPSNPNITLISDKPESLDCHFCQLCPNVSTGCIPPAAPASNPASDTIAPAVILATQTSAAPTTSSMFEIAQLVSRFM